MPIIASTKLFVIARDGMSETTLKGLANAFKGGLDPETIEVTLDPAEAKRLEAKQRAIAALERLGDAVARSPGHETAQTRLLSVG